MTTPAPTVRAAHPPVGTRASSRKIPTAAKNPPANRAAASGTSMNTMMKATGPTAQFYPASVEVARIATVSRVACPGNDFDRE
ncbi:MAG TPA: hypothetical protein VG034_27170, partial [Acidimicrobiia bacterium]|nr:hypothetical protein [Acidimicrobiia bacterium]